MNNTRKLPQKSRVSPKNPQNTTGYHDKTPTSPIEALLSTITVNFAKISQDKPNFTARVNLLAAQKNKKNQKTAASTTSRGFVIPKKGN
jgi:hypothetical protein